MKVRKAKKKLNQYFKKSNSCNMMVKKIKLILHNSEVLLQFVSIFLFCKTSDAKGLKKMRSYLIDLLRHARILFLLRFQRLVLLFFTLVNKSSLFFKDFSYF